MEQRLEQEVRQERGGQQQPQRGGQLQPQHETVTELTAADFGSEQEFEQQRYEQQLIEAQIAETRRQAERGKKVVQANVRVEGDGERVWTQSQTGIEGVW